MALAAPIGRLAVPALGAGFACSCRINEHNGDPGLLCFVTDEVRQLSERPAHTPVLILHPEPDGQVAAREVFEHNERALTLGLCEADYGLGNLVIDVRHETGFSSANGLQTALGRASAFALKRRAQTDVAETGLLDPATANEHHLIPAGSGHKEAHALVNADHGVEIVGVIRYRLGDGHVQIPAVSLPNQFGVKSSLWTPQNRECGSMWTDRVDIGGQGLTWSLCGHDLAFRAAERRTPS